MGITRTQAIKNFLMDHTHQDLANLYNHDMECQVKVAQDNGERVQIEAHGKKTFGFQNQTTGDNWKDFRIPINAKTEPFFDDKEMTYNLEVHVEGIGMTGWDWVKRCSRWVAFDFDSVAQHSERHQKKLTDEQLHGIQVAVADIPWVTLRKSTGGRGLHLYVMLIPVATSNHDEHAAVARAILGQISMITGANLQSKVDTCGGNMWVWHRKMRGTDGLKIVKQGIILTEVPPNWRDHVKVVTGRRTKAIPGFVSETATPGAEDIFEQVSAQRPKVMLDDEHRRFLNWLEQKNAAAVWHNDYHMLATHTIYLKEAQQELQLRGIFETISKGKDKGYDMNCFMFPMKRGAWTVRRYTPGVAEAPTWEQDGQGFTRCYFNHEPDLKSASLSNDGKEHPTGGYVFDMAEQAQNAAAMLGADLTLPGWAFSRNAKMKENKEGKLVVEINAESTDNVNELRNWIREGKSWKRVFAIKSSEPLEIENKDFDDLIRHLVTEDHVNYGWAIKSDGHWRMEPLAHVKPVLKSCGIKAIEVDSAVGAATIKPWKIVNKPFQPEWLEDRQWNREAAQLKFQPSNSENPTYPHWMKILTHCGQNLDSAIKNLAWAKANGVTTGAEYLRLWIASLFQKPMEPLPYLFFHGPQNSGKTIFHEAIRRLLTRGYKRADVALSNSGAFNAELEFAVLCVVEETDLRKNQIAYNRIKDWVTSVTLPIHGKGKTPYQVPNSTHWVQCANRLEACPIFPGDTRITMSYVADLDPAEMIPMRELVILLEKEAPDFLQDILTIEIPPCHDRLNIPVVVTEDKRLSEDANQTLLEMYIKDQCHVVSGEMIPFSEFYDKFREWLEITAPNQMQYYTRLRVAREFPRDFPKAKQRGSVHTFIGNLSWEPRSDDSQIKSRLIIRNDYLEYEA